MDVPRGNDDQEMVSFHANRDGLMELALPLGDCKDRACAVGFHHIPVLQKMIVDSKEKITHTSYGGLLK